MAPRAPLIAILASAGGLAALTVVLGALPAALAAAVLVVQHLQSGTPSALAQILGRRTALRVCGAREGDWPCVGTVHVAPPDHHLVSGRDGRIRLSEQPPVHFCRPSGDRMFASLTAAYGPAGMAVVLTGRGVDGAEGA